MRACVVIVSITASGVRYVRMIVVPFVILIGFDLLVVGLVFLSVEDPYHVF